MESSWPFATVDELMRKGVLAPPIDGNHGAIHPKASDFVTEGIPFIMASDLVNGVVDLKGCARISPAQARTLRKGFSVSGDVLLSHKGTVGRTAMVGAIDSEYIVLSPQVTYYRVLDQTQLCPRFLKYYFDSAGFQNIFATWAGAGSTRAYLGITAQQKLPICLAPIQQQRSIASVLGAVDDRITLLRETNATIESVAQAIFKSWFVDFDPVRATAEGPEREDLGAGMETLFPSEFEESKIGPLPKGWYAGCFGDLARLSTGSVNPLTRRTTEFQHYSLPAFDEGQLPIEESGAGILSNKTLVPQGAVLMSKLNPHIPRVWFTGKVGENSICSTEFLPWTPAFGACTEYLYCLLKAPSFWGAVQSLVTGTSNSHQRVKAEQVAALPTVIPPREVILAFQRIVSPLLSRVVQGRRQVQAILALRDVLLPRLISGKLGIPEAQAVVQEALT